MTFLITDILSPPPEPRQLSTSLLPDSNKFESLLASLSGSESTSSPLLSQSVALQQNLLTLLNYYYHHQQNRISYQDGVNSHEGNPGIVDYNAESSKSPISPKLVNSSSIKRRSIGGGDRKRRLDDVHDEDGDKCSECDEESITSRYDQEGAKLNSNSALDALIHMATSSIRHLQSSPESTNGSSGNLDCPSLLHPQSLISSGSKKRKTRTTFSNSQLGELEANFNRQKYLTPSDRDRIAGQLGLSNTQVITWFQNRRAKLKRETEELERDLLASREQHQSHQTSNHQHLTFLPIENSPCIPSFNGLSIPTLANLGSLIGAMTSKPIPTFDGAPGSLSSSSSADNETEEDKPIDLAKRDEGDKERFWRPAFRSSN